MVYSKWKSVGRTRIHQHRRRPEKKTYLTQISHKIIYERMLLTVYRTRIRAKYCKQGRVCVPSWKSAHRYDLHNIFYELYVFAQYNPIDSIQYS